jgi:hypothetical protein
MTTVYRGARMSDIPTKTPFSDFPAATDPSNPNPYAADMTLRDFFANHAMRVLLASDTSFAAHVLALESYEVADAMLKARNA